MEQKPTTKSITLNKGKTLDKFEIVDQPFCTLCVEIDYKGQIIGRESYQLFCDAPGSNALNTFIHTGMYKELTSEDTSFVGAFGNETSAFCSSLKDFLVTGISFHVDTTDAHGTEGLLMQKVFIEAYQWSFIKAHTMEETRLMYTQTMKFSGNLKATVYDFSDPFLMRCAAHQNEQVVLYGRRNAPPNKELFYIPETYRYMNVIVCLHGKFQTPCNDD